MVQFLPLPFTGLDILATLVCIIIRYNCTVDPVLPPPFYGAVYPQFDLQLDSIIQTVPNYILNLSAHPPSHLNFRGILYVIYSVGLYVEQICISKCSPLGGDRSAGQFHGRVRPNGPCHSAGPGLNHAGPSALWGVCRLPSALSWTACNLPGEMRGGSSWWLCLVFLGLTFSIASLSPLSGLLNKLLFILFFNPFSLLCPFWAG